MNTMVLSMSVLKVLVPVIMLQVSLKPSKPIKAISELVSDKLWERQDDLEERIKHLEPLLVAYTKFYDQGQITCVSLLKVLWPSYFKLAEQLNQLTGSPPVKTSQRSKEALYKLFARFFLGQWALMCSWAAT